MKYFVQYHNVAKLGWVPLDEVPFLQTKLSIGTRKAVARRSVGATVFVIASLGRPRRYFLWEHFVVEGVEAEGDDLCVQGTGRQLAPPALLSGEDFDAFKSACANFVGFRSIDGLPFTRTLVELSRREPDLGEECERFCTMLVEELPRSGDAHYARGWLRLRLGRPLDAVTDLAEAVRRGTEFLGEAKEALRLAAARV